MKGALIMNYYLGVDMGTSSMKATLIDNNGSIVWHVSRPTSLISPRDGFYEVNSDIEWWQNFISICEEIRAAGYSDKVMGIAISSVCATFLPVDKDFMPLSNAVLYGIDRRAAHIADELNARYGKEFLTEKLGGTFSTQSILPKILWFKRELPQIYASTRFFVPSFDAVSSCLTGKCAWDTPTAFGALLLELESLNYPQWFLDDFDIDISLMPPVKSGLSELGPLTAKGAETTGFNEGIPVMTGTGDINAEAMSADATAAGTAIFTLGSTISMLLNCEKPASVPGYISGVSLMDNTWRIGAASSCGGLFLNKAKAAFGNGYIPEKPTNIFYLPYSNGARSPYNAPTARGCIFGLCDKDTLEDIAASAYETIGYDIALLITKAQKARSFPDEIHITGGLCHDKGLIQLTADIIDKKLLVHTSCDASFGSALIAARKNGVFIHPTPDAVVTPSTRSSLYRPLKERYIALCDKIIAI